MRAPNSEQKLAIEHTGGVLLSAGAGSGKTFVLVEHIVYLIDQFNQRTGDVGLIEYEQKLRSYLSSIVLMTFTKKAAGELALRLKRRIEAQAEIAERPELWGIAESALGVLTVSTIHGFCFKLLGGGYITELSPDLKMLTEAESSDKINRLFEEWLDHELEGEEDLTLQTFIANKRRLSSSLCGIFGDPSIRLMWKKLDTAEVASESLEEFFSQCFDIMELSPLFDNPIDLAQHASLSDKKWYQYINDFLELKSSVVLKDLDSIKSYLDLFAKYTRTQAPRKTTGLFDVIDYMAEIKRFKSFISDIHESLEGYWEHRDSAYTAWLHKFKSLFEYIDSNYMKVEGLNFSDLEYYVLKGLEDDEVCKRIAETYRYFIVDEFQDTSYIQFEIVRKLIDDNFSKLFCVGDMKQAIYGFRGGELGVFKDCMEKVSKNLTLKNNYRSKQHVIEFNNYLFDNLFKKGLKFTGVDTHAVDVVYQTYPWDSDGSGQLCKLDVVVESDEAKPKLSSSEMSRFEAEAIFKKIVDLRQSKPEEQVCILYRKLSPTKFLIPLLLENGVDFTSQIKVPLGTDPIMGLLKVLLESYLAIDSWDSREKLVDLVSLQIIAYLTHLKVECNADLISETVSCFYSNIRTLGLEEAFNKFIYTLALANSNYSNNKMMVTAICSLAKDDPEKALLIMRDNIEGQYSIDFQVGHNASKVIIMTAHASKGLEFDHVILGGVHNNGGSMPNKDLFGKLPGSFCWKATTKQRKVYKSPNFILEKLINDRKEFAESKRLFYVASTRAVESLSWVDLNIVDKPASYGDSNWIDGIRSWENDFEDKARSIFEHIKSETKPDQLVKIEEESAINNPTPLFHLDSLGIVSRSLGDSQLGTLAELSVTRLASIVECPRKFYLKNICKLSEEELDLFSMNVEYTTKKDKNDFESENDFFASSAERGTELHFRVSEIIKSNMQNVECDEDPGVKWVIDLLKSDYSDAKLISEEAIKFPLWGHMISGIPDLIVQRSDGGVEIWDFKTGKRGESKEIPYWFQLKCYAYAAYKLSITDNNTPVKVILAYLDEKNLVEHEVTAEGLAEEFESHRQILADFGRVNDAHCSECLFGNICHL